MHGTKEPCPNCGTKNPGAYCPACGQAQGPLLVPVRVWLGEAFEELLAVDAKLPRSLRRLFWPPGELTLEWLLGRRARYVSPFRIYLATAFLFFFAWPLTPFQSAMQSAAAGALDGFAEGAGDIGETARLADHTFQDAVQVISDNLPSLALVLLVPVFAALLYAANRGRHGYVGNLITAFHIHGATFLAMILTVPLHLLLPDSSGDVIILVLLGLLWVYVLAVVKRVYASSLLTALLSTVFVTGCYLIIAITAVGGAVGLVSAIL